jgi:glycosyltransferase involved in cell wall biosynthesis
MKIAWLSYFFHEYSIKHANELAKSHDVRLMLPDNRLDDRSAIDPAVDYTPFYGPRYRQPFSQLRTVHQIIRSIKQFQPDVIHFQNGHLYMNWFLRLIRKYPLVVTIHDPRHHPGDKESLIIPQWLMDSGFRQADQVIVHGSELVETVNREIGIPKDRIHVIPHIAIGERPSVNKDQETGPNILFFGRIWEYKGLDYFIKAEAIVSREFPDVKFVIGGKGEDFDRYRQMMQNPDRFEVHNDYVSDDQRAELFAKSSIVVLPYLEASQSGVIPIAYTFGKPVIATRVGGLPEMVEHGKTGLLVPPKDVESLAEAIVQLLRDPALRRRMGEAGCAKLKSECDAGPVIAKTLEVYRAAIEQRQPASVAKSTRQVAT